MTYVKMIHVELNEINNNINKYKYKYISKLKNKK